MKVYGVLIIAKNAKMEGMSEWYDSWWDKAEKAVERANHVFFKEDQDERFEKIEVIGYELNKAPRHANADWDDETMVSVATINANV